MIKSSTGLTNAEKLRRCFDGLGTLTSKEDVLRHFTHRVLLEAARKEGCAALMFASNSTRLAVQAISQISKGRGFALPIEVADNSAWYKDVIVLRPFRDVLGKELAILSVHDGLQTVVVPTLTTATPIKSSIDRLTEDFVIGLQRDFPSTVSTISRTAFKITTQYAEEGVGGCPICAR
ncbi:hypothetical protein BDK51DRAFT_24743 [Blyttiomyces helicus]|uniref:Uncharacterized protein n=1 Tax=Blyttiomyces helicus TaxID=388810 RepID=A0A4P9WJT2_9FUNG|nr:hypothetical protein BDK51DRAFT_24743 [Blyttiomyces helicus]|eukprot:RKO93034.1 hypothetical protein BDK51DRAFT_24743 [Blyttiomyces helicus]